jgi:hypothetical protein
MVGVPAHKFGDVSSTVQAVIPPRHWLVEPMVLRLPVLKPLPTTSRPDTVGNHRDRCAVPGIAQADKNRVGLFNNRPSAAQSTMVRMGSSIHGV